MDKDTKVLLMAVVIILVALVSFNLSDLTGKVTTSKASITVTPTLLNFDKNDAAKIITVKLDLGSNKVEQKLHLYRESARGDERLSTESLLLCRSSVCGSDDINSMYKYRVDSGLDSGRYYFVARNRMNNEIVAKSNKFTIVN